MSQFDFATVQVYQTPEHLEVVFPYNEDFISFLKDLKGRWDPKRRCWTVKSENINKTTDEILFSIEDKLYNIAPKGWKKAVHDLSKVSCLINGNEIYAGAGGVRLTLPSGHPGHYYLKEVKGLLNNKNNWSIPAHLVAHPEVKKMISRVMKEDKLKYYDLMEVSQDRCIIGHVKVPPEQETIYNLEKGQYILTTKSFMLKVDPGIGDAPIEEFCFEVLKTTRINDEDLKLRLEYPDIDRQYAFLKSQKNNPKKSKPLDSNVALDDWIQKRS